MAMIHKATPWDDSGMSFTLSNLRNNVISNTMAARAKLAKDLDERFKEPEYDSSSNVLEPGQPAFGNDELLQEPVLRPGQPAPGHDIFSEEEPESPPVEEKNKEVIPEKVEPIRRATPIERQTTPPDIKLPANSRSIVSTPIQTSLGDLEYNFGRASTDKEADKILSRISSKGGAADVGAKAFVTSLEMGSEKGYNESGISPMVPNRGGVPLGKSGVTLAGGLDLGQMSKDRHWSVIAQNLDKNTASLLSGAVGLKGYQAMNYIKKNGLDKIEIPYDKAIDMNEKFLEVYNKDMVKAFPGIEKMSKGVQGAVLSATFQHGMGIGGFNGMLKMAIKNGNKNDVLKVLKGLASKYPDYKNRRQMEIDYLSMN